MKLGDLYAASSFQRELENAQHNLAQFRNLVFSDEAKRVRADKASPTIELALTTPQLGTLFLKLDEDDTAFLAIENRLQIRIREAAEKLRRLGVDVPQDIAA